MLDGKDSRGGFIDSSVKPPRVYHATPEGIYSWPDGDVDKMEIVSGVFEGLGSGGVCGFVGGSTEAERERESYAKRSCVDLKHGIMGRAPWCNTYTVPLPLHGSCSFPLQWKLCCNARLIIFK
jgi:hypothetical protein